MSRRHLLALAAVAALLMFVLGCGSSNSSSHQPQAPVFTSTPVTEATQGVAYSYQLAATDPAGGTVSFALTTAPSGATLSASAVSWTPTAAESRASNNFEVTATTSSGGSATQSWTVTPNGTITVNWMNTYWGPNGAVQVAALPSVATTLSALWTNSDGSISTEKASATSSGVFSIPNVPAGNYWLQIGSMDFWTNTSTFDAGSNYAGLPAPTTTGVNDTNFTFDLSGLDSVPEMSGVNFAVPVYGAPPLFNLIDDANSTSLSQTIGLGSDTDWSQINTAYFTQLVPSPLGALNNLVAASTLIATNLHLSDGQPNTITETLEPAPQTSISFSVSGSQWAPLLMGANVAPSGPTPLASTLSIVPQIYVTQGLASGTVSLAPNVSVGIGTLASPAGLVVTQLPNSISGIACGSAGFPLGTPVVAQAAITSDQNFGTLQYGDPYPSTWGRTLTLCQEALAAIPLPNSSSTATFVLVDAATVAPSNTPVAPVVLPVQNPLIDTSGSLFGATSANSNIVTLSWTAPTGTTPFAYTVRVFIQTAIEGEQSYSATGAAFSTSGTSITLPPLSGGNTYVFTITADGDGNANIQTSPFRSALPTGYATVVSGPVTINSGTQMPAIHGDRTVVERFSKPLSHGSSR